MITDIINTKETKKEKVFAAIKTINFLSMVRKTAFLVLSDNLIARQF
jgi:hypothetical protein